MSSARTLETTVPWKLDATPFCALRTVKPSIEGGNVPDPLICTTVPEPPPSMIVGVGPRTRWLRVVSVPANPPYKKIAEPTVTFSL